MNYYPMPNSMYPPFPMPGRAPFQPNLAPPLYVGNLDETVYEEQLFAHFSKYGPLHSLKIVKDRVTNRSRGFGYINFSNAKDAENARLLSQYEKIGKSPIRIMYKRNIHEIGANNIFVKNVDPNVASKELHNLFAKVGPVVSVKIASNNRGESLGYGYVLMEKEEDAKTAIEQMNGFKLKEKEISCNEFKARDKRDIRGNNNLYVKGLPVNVPENQIQKQLHDEFSKFGNIISLKAELSKDGKWFAFVCFEDANAAEEATKALNNSTVFGSEPLYVAKHQSRHQRDFELKKNYATTKNDTNLFIKNLKPEVTKEQVKQAFSEFGEVGNTAVFTKEFKPDDSVKGYGFVSFKVAQDALKAQTDGPKSDDIKNLFIDGQEVYINFWQPKSQRDQFKASKRRPNDFQRMPAFMPRSNPYAQMPNDMRMMNFAPFPMMNPMMRPPYGGVPRGQNVQRGGYQQRRGGPYQGNRPQTHPRPNAGPTDRYGSDRYGNRGPRPQQGNRPGQRTDFHSQQNQPVHQQHTLQQAKETRTTPQQDVALEANLTVQSLKDKLEDFLKLEPEKQRNILGELLFPKILRKSRPEHAPKITGMLVDFEVLTVQDILEMLEDDGILEERISEAQELINSEGQN
jgi:polyadenylate-binding protein